jgi:Flp pilus assembly protein TadB
MTPALSTRRGRRTSTESVPRLSWVVPWGRRSRRRTHRSASLGRPPLARRPAAPLARQPAAPPSAAGGGRLEGLLARVPRPGRAAALRREMEEAVPEVVDVLRATVAAGINPRRALQAAAEGAPSSLEALLGQAIRAAELGAGAGSALATAARTEGLPELLLAGEALDLAETTGAPPGPVLAGVATAAADRVRSRQARMAATAQARLSARVVAAMAPAFLGVLALTAPSDAAFLVREPLGWSTLAAAAVLELLGIGWATHIVRGPSRRIPSEPPPERRRPDRAGRPHRMAGLARVGAAVAAGVSFGAAMTAAVPGLVLVAVLALVAWPVMGWVARRRAAARRLAVRSGAAPAVLDLLGAALLAGLNPHKAVIRVAERAPEALHQDLSLAAAVLRLGGTPAAALRAAADRSGLDELRAAAAALEAAERWGAPPAEALAARAEALRSRARLHAEAEAGRAAVRLAFPLVLCFLPAFVLTTVELCLQSD